MSDIARYLTHSVDVVKVKLVKGVRTTTIKKNIPAFISQGTNVITSSIGFHLEHFTKVYLKGNENVRVGDELVLQGDSRPIKRILASRGFSPEIHHLEVELG